MYDFRPKVPVTITQTGESFDCPVGESVLKGMLRLGRKGIPVGCVNGGCGVCKIRVTTGEVTSLQRRVSNTETLQVARTAPRGLTVRLAKAFGGTEDGWLVQQAHYELAQVRRDQINVRCLRVA